MRSKNREVVMKNFSVTPTAKTLVIGFSLLALAMVACTSADDPDPTATQKPAPATQAPAPTATTEPQTGGETPLAPTETPVAVEEPTKAPDPTVAPVATQAPAPTATPDPFVTLKSIISGDVEPNRFIEVSPGDGELLERLFADAPPVAAHYIGDIRITLKSNQCITCHEGGFASGGSVATGIPISHYTDQYTMDVSNDLDPRRYMCTSCHVAQVTDPVPWAE
ncbi:hypothetical protein GKN94_08380 [Candidatus Lucifugimonas marina]|uniref:Periplasmic nitrate reductase, electron transfer subunit n=2 Tax=Candidatus Lucifugimonas marina TaxID=3038979 RepID=A0AAJ5ZES8_9CHLR|nr:hypothetical protein [SAR202 cluster bacterium JH702]MDG0869088.1 hypothetical protein [SAR202 cluster bacterium JH639]WFG35709.1 hypothetical protein GKN94_08380 [SAR202 cluster bacterium JH545]WFG39655.1 hypothetical protein GKO48_08490 [SAR202 cluster bacterium JH1073]